MEIHFCDRCHESIPDPDFDAGRAVRVGGKSLHVACALRNAMPGPARALTFVLALAGLGLAAFAVARATAATSEAPKEAAVQSADLLRMRQDLEGSLERLRANVAGLESAVGAQVEARLKGVRAEDQDALDRLSRTIAELSGKLTAYADQFEKRLSANEGRISEIATWVKEVKELAQKTAVAAPPPAAPPAPAPVSPEPAAAPPVAGNGGAPPPPLDPEAAKRREADLQRWIALLRDPNEGIAFTATRKLAELKDLKAVPPLIDVLKTHRDYFTRQGAASTLGELQAADAVPSLMDALEDKDDTVQIAASEALSQITQQDFKFSLVLTKKEKKQIKEQWGKWWRENEGDVRKRLGQPKS
jgi:hypothetical protein